MRLLVTICLALASAPAFAQHEHVHDDHHQPAAVAASVALVAASFDTMTYAGNYQGILPSVHVAHGRVAAIVSGSMYRLEKNGGEFYGIGDAAVHGQAQLVARGDVLAGLAFGVTAPTGNMQRGFGMGHVMIMPAAYGTWSRSRVRVGGSLGYSRAFTDESHADHGPWPLVSPMLPSELSWQAGAEALVSHAVVTGVRASGGIPIATDGPARVIIGGRVAWRLPTLETAFEVQVGVSGDPFNVRGVATTTLSF